MMMPNDSHAHELLYLVQFRKFFHCTVHGEDTRIQYYLKPKHVSILFCLLLIVLISFSLQEKKRKKIVYLIPLDRFSLVST